MNNIKEIEKEPDNNTEDENADMIKKIIARRA